MARDIADAVREAREHQPDEPVAPSLRVMRVTTLADLQSGSVPATMTVRGKPINIEYDPDGITLESLLQASDLQSGNGQAQDLIVLTDFLTSTIRRWDLRESADGEVVELSAERLAKFGIGLLADMARALVKASRMGEANGTPSPQRSSRTRTSARRSSSRR